MKRIIIITAILILISCKHQDRQENVLTDREYKYGLLYNRARIQALSLSISLGIFPQEHQFKHTKERYDYTQYCLKNIDKIKFAKYSLFNNFYLLNPKLLIGYFWEPIFDKQNLLDIHHYNFIIAIDSTLRYYYFYSEPTLIFNDMIGNNLTAKDNYSKSDVIKLVDLFLKLAYFDDIDFNSSLKDTLADTEINNSSLLFNPTNKGYRVSGNLPKLKCQINIFLNKKLQVVEHKIDFNNDYE